MLFESARTRDSISASHIHVLYIYIFSFCILTQQHVLCVPKTLPYLLRARSLSLSHLKWCMVHP